MLSASLSPVASSGSGAGMSTRQTLERMSFSSGPWAASMNSAASSTVRVSGPWWTNASKVVSFILNGMRPTLGLGPTSAQ